MRKLRRLLRSEAKDASLRDLFEKLDRNGDRHITAIEFRKGLKDLGFRLDDHEVRGARAETTPSPSKGTGRSNAAKISKQGVREISRRSETSSSTATWTATARFRTSGRAEILPIGLGFAMAFKRTTPAVQRCKNQQQRRSYGRDRVGRRYLEFESFVESSEMKDAGVQDVLDRLREIVDRSPKHTRVARASADGVAAGARGSFCADGVTAVRSRPARRASGTARSRTCSSGWTRI